MRLCIQILDSKKLEFTRFSCCGKKSRKPWELLGDELELEEGLVSGRKIDNLART